MSDIVQVPGYNPAQNRVPGAFAVVDASKANAAQEQQRTLLIGQMLSAGTATAGEAILSAGIGDARSAFGSGSILAVAVERYRAIDPNGEVWCLPVADAGSATAATASIAFSGTAAANGTVRLYVDGHYVGVGVASGDAETAVGAATAVAINAWASPGGNPLSWTAAADTGTVTLTARNKGTLPNTGSLVLSYRGTAGGEGVLGSTNVPGITATITAPSGGATDPTLSTALANLPQRTFDFIGCPYADSTSLGAIGSFLGDTAGRWLWSSALYGGAFVAKGGTFSARTTWSLALNDQHLSAIGAYGSPSPDWHWAIDYCAAAAVSLRANPSVPVGGLGGGVALNVAPPQLKDQDDFAEWNTLLFDGMSAYVVESGVVRVKRAITTYQKNAGGAPDNSYLDLNVPYQLAAFIRAWRTMVLSNFNQAILVSDGTRILPGSRMVTPSTIKFATVALYRQEAAFGLVQNPDQFAQQIQATNAGGGQVTMLLPVQLAGQLIAVAADVQFTRP